jgi:hypothetical protein
MLDSSFEAPERTVVQADGVKELVVAQVDEDCGDIFPSPSNAATEKQYWVAGVSPLTVYPLEIVVNGAPLP